MSINTKSRRLQMLQKNYSFSLMYSITQITEKYNEI